MSNIEDIQNEAFRKIKKEFFNASKGFSKLYNSIRYYNSDVSDRLVNKHYLYALEENEMIDATIEDLKEMSVSYFSDDFFKRRYKHDVDFLMLECTFHSFKYCYCDFMSFIRIDFYDLYYSVYNSSQSVFIRKKYNEQLTDREIKSLVEAETNLHKELIAQKIKEFQEKK